jgi:hypothetical protein
MRATDASRIQLRPAWSRRLPAWFYVPARFVGVLAFGIGSLLAVSRVTRFISDHVYQRGWLPRPLLAIVGIALYGAVVVAILFVTRFYRLWVFWRLPPEQQGWTLIGDFFVAFAVVTFGFVVILQFAMIDGQWFRFKAALGDFDVFDAQTLWAYYVWNFFDAIPVLKITEALNWKQPIKFTDHVSGAFLLLYRVLMIIPLIGFIMGLAHVLTAPRTRGRAGGVG